jgi:hypothetical protein
MYYDNKDGLTGNPEVATHYYGYLRGLWKDGSRVTAGGNGLHGATPVDYMFPGDPGACGAASGWNELSEGNPADDRQLHTLGWAILLTKWGTKRDHHGSSLGSR